MSDVQTFIEVKQHPQSGPETPQTMCEKFEDFLKNSIFDYFLTFCHGPPPHGLTTVMLLVGAQFPCTQLCAHILGTRQSDILIMETIFVF